MTVMLAAGTPRAVWYLTRGAGAVTLIGLTITLALGIVDVQRVRTSRLPRFALDALHRNVALVTLGVLAVHVITAVVDTYAPIRLLDAVLPFASSYRPLWLGLGALAFDILLAVAITSGLRRRLGYRAWRGVHWAAYACWPLAVVHGLGTGSDIRSAWMPVLTVACVVVVAGAAAWRLATSDAPSRPAKALTAGVAALGLLGVAAWAKQGPLAPHWSRRSGTPLSLLASATAQAATPAPRSAQRSPQASAPARTLQAPFTARLAGTVSERMSPGGGEASVDLPLAVSGGAAGRLHVAILGRPLPSGGVVMTSGTVSLGPAQQPALYRGHVTALRGRSVSAVVRARDGAALLLDIRLSPATADHHISGSITAARG